MDVSQDSEGFLYSMIYLLIELILFIFCIDLIVEGVNYGELPHMDRLAVSKALEAAKKAKGGKKEVKEVEIEQEEEEEEEPEPEPEEEEEEEETGHKAAAKKTKKPVKKAAAKKAPPKKKVVKKVIKQEENVNVFDLDEGEDINSFTGEQSVEDMMANLTMKIDPDMIAKYQQHQQEEKKKEENYDSFDGLVDLGSGFSQKFKEAPKPKIAGASATETRKNLAKPTAALQGATYGMAAPKIGFGGAQTDEFGNPLNPMMQQQTTNVDMAFGMGGMQGGMGMGGMGGMGGGMGYGMQGGMGGMGGMQGGMGGMGGMQGGMGGMGGMNNMGGGFGQQGFNQGGFGF